MNYSEKLKQLIKENPTAEIKIFVDDLINFDEYSCVEGEVYDISVNDLALWNDERWVDKNCYFECLIDELWEHYYDYDYKFVENKAEEELKKVEFKKFICIHVG